MCDLLEWKISSPFYVTPKLALTPRNFLLQTRLWQMDYAHPLHMKWLTNSWSFQMYDCSSIFIICVELVYQLSFDSLMALLTIESRMRNFLCLAFGMFSCEFKTFKSLKLEVQILTCNSSGQLLSLNYLTAVTSICINVGQCNRTIYEQYSPFFIPTNIAYCW